MEDFFAQFDAREVAAPKFGVFGHAAHLKLKDGKAPAAAASPLRRFI